jgi:hypothetical protein
MNSDFSDSKPTVIYRLPDIYIAKCPAGEASSYHTITTAVWTLGAHKPWYAAILTYVYNVYFRIFLDQITLK